MLTIPRQEIRRARRERLGLTQEALAEQMSRARWDRVGQDEYAFTFQQVARLEAGRCAIVFDDDQEPLWWALVVLAIPLDSLFTRDEVERTQRRLLHGDR